MDNSLVSIILPVYNGEKYLSFSIESCLNQTYRNIELIIVNDCSTDETLSICNRYAEKDSRIRIINNIENKKLPASLNIGHKEAKGDFITWTSDDNFYELNALEILLDEMAKNEVDIVYSDFNLIDDKSQKIREVSLLGLENMIFGNFIACSFLYKKEVFQKNSGYNENYFLIEDYDFWLRALLHSNFYKINKCLFNYRKHDQSLTHQIAFDEERKVLWKKNVKEMLLSFWEDFVKTDYIVITELVSNFLLFEKVEFQWLINNNDKIEKIKEEIKKNKNFSDVILIDKVFLKKTIEVLIKEKKTKKNLGRSLFIIRKYAKVLDRNSIKTLIKYSFFKYS